MIKLVNKEDIKEADKNTWSRIKSIDLMEDAGYKMFKRIKNNLINKKIIIILGKGGNAGDGLVVARYLFENNYDVSVYLLDELSSDALINLNRYKGNIAKELNLANYDIIIDAIFGVGLSRYLDDKYINIINEINDSNKYIISLDMPSGIDATNGISYGAYIKCNLLLTVEYLKLGLFLNDGLSSYDDYKIIKINLDKPKYLYNLLELNDFKNIYPKRLNNTHKGSFGKASIIAGSSKYPGASIISYNSLISFMMGLGYQRLYVVKELYDKYQYNPEIIVNKIDSDNGIIKYNENDLNEIIKSSDTISIGMGMDISIDLYNSIKYLLNNFKGILILDADALNT
ncbi:MAG: NAD(P)H-hydrate epimerase, partial [Acholeplasmatales bacterium]|nr:NAD(P)H-hydrate epimerase [Acholeplasmatales bacterium]